MKLKKIIIALAIGFITLSNNVWCYADETPSKAINILTEEQYQNENSLMEQERLRIEQEILEEIKNNPVTLSEVQINPMGLPDIDPMNNPASDNWLTREVARQVSKDNPASLTQEDFNKVKQIKLNEKQITQIPSNIGNLFYLEILELNDNKITEIPLEVFNLTNLWTIHMTNNQIIEIPSYISNLVNLDTLCLINNQIEEVSLELFNLPKLRVLDLTDNKITKIPSGNFDVPKLDFLSLVRNKIPKVPHQIFSLNSLTCLFLDSYQMTEIPPEIGNLTKLAWLGFGSAPIIKIPPQISNLTNLQYLFWGSEKIILDEIYISPNEEFTIKNPINALGNPVIPTNISNNGVYNADDNTITWVASDANRDETFNFSESITIGNATRMFQATVTLPTIVEKEEPLSLELFSNIASQTINTNDTLSIPISLKGTGDYYALDTQIEYNSELLEFKGYSVKNGLKAYYSSNENNTLRYILASQGKDNPINSSVSDIVYLNFTPKKTGITDIKIKSGKIANLDKEVDINDLGSISITIEEQTQVKDINRDGKFTLIDLAIDGYYYGMNVNETDNTKYEADIISDGKIDDTDLKEIVKHILNNPDYSK